MTDVRVAARWAAVSRSTRRLRAAAWRIPVHLAALGSDEPTILLTLAVVIGAAAGAAVTGFYKTIDLVQELVLRGATHAIVPDYLLIPAVVALGLVACRSLVRWAAKSSSARISPTSCTA